MATASHCLQCGGPLVHGTLGNRCPRCLMGMSLSDTDEADKFTPVAVIRQFGDYELLEEVGRGGMGVVYRARQISLNRIVAVKMLLARPFAVPELEERLHLEAEAAAGLNHPHIVTIYDFGECDDQFYFSMEYIEGRSLAQLTRHHSLAPRQAAQYLKTVAEAVQHAHEHDILHRDLKPSNILIDLHDQVKITDFGLAKRLGTDSELTLTGALVGSPNYLSPEQAAGQHRALTARSDVYSLGAVLCQLLTARPPLVGESLQETLVQIREKEVTSLRLLNPQIPRDLETICLKCLRKEPEQRYASAQELADDLVHFLEARPITARPISALGRTWRWCRRRPALATALMTLLALLLVIGVGSPVAVFRISQARLAAEQALEEARLNQYAGDMVAVQQALKEGNLGHARRLLSLHQPEPGQEDLRGFEWRYFAEQCRPRDLLTLTGHENLIECMTYSPDGQHLVSGGRDNAVRVWDVAQRKTVQVLGPYSSYVCCLRFSLDGRFLFVGVVGRQVEVLQRAEGGIFRLVRTLPIPVTRFVVHPELTLLIVSSSRTLEVQGWNYLEGEQVFVLPKAGSRVALSRDASKFATGGDFVELYDFASRKRLWQAKPAGGVNALSLSGNGELVCSTDGMGNVQIWKASSGELYANLVGHTANVHHTDWSPTGDVLATGSSDHTIRLWKLPEAKLMRTIRGHGSEVRDVAFHPEGRLLASCSKDKTIKVWSLGDPEDPSKVGTPPSLRGYAVHDGLLVGLDADADGVGVGWDLRQQRERWRTRAPMEHLGLCNGGRIGAVLERQLVLLNAATGVAERRLPLPTAVANTRALKISPDGNWFMAGYNGLRIEVYTVGETSLTLAATLSGAVRIGGNGFAFSHDSRFLAFEIEERRLGVFDLISRETHTSSEQHDLGIMGIAFSPLGELIVTGSQDGTAKLWNTGDLKEVATLTGFKEGLADVSFSPDGLTVAAVAGDGAFDAVRLWNVATARQVAVLNLEKAKTWLYFMGLDAKGEFLMVGPSDRQPDCLYAPSFAELSGMFEETQTTR